MSDQAEKLRERMRKLKDPIKEMKRVAIVGAQAHAHVALFSYNLAKALVNEDGSPLILEEESDYKDEEHLNVLLNLHNQSKVDEKRDDTLFLEPGQMTQREGVSILSVPFSQSRFLDQESAYNQLSFFLGKQTTTHHSLLLVQYTSAENEFQERLHPNCQLIVTRGEPTDLVSAYTIIKELHSKNRELAVGVVITQVESENLALTAFETLNAVSLRFLEKSLVYCGSLTKSRGETSPKFSDWFGRENHTSTVYDQCRRFIFQETVNT